MSSGVARKIPFIGLLAGLLILAYVSLASLDLWGRWLASEEKGLGGPVLVGLLAWGWLMWGGWLVRSLAPRKQDPGG